MKTSLGFCFGLKGKGESFDPNVYTHTYTHTAPPGIVSGRAILDLGNLSDDDRSGNNLFLL